MRPFLLISLWLLISMAMAQTTPVKVRRVANESTPISIGLSIGDLIYDINNDVYYYVREPVGPSNSIEDVKNDLTALTTISGETGEIIYNDNGASGSEPAFNYNAVNNILTVDNIELTANKSKIRLNPLLMASNDYSGITARFTGTMLALQVAYISGNNSIAAADADVSSQMPAIGITINTSEEILTHGFVRNSSWSFTAGQPIYVSTTAGAITNSPPGGVGCYVQQIGFAINANTVFFTFDTTLIKQ